MQREKILNENNVTAEVDDGTNRQTGKIIPNKNNGAAPGGDESGTRPDKLFHKGKKNKASAGMRAKKAVC